MSRVVPFFNLFRTIPRFSHIVGELSTAHRLVQQELAIQESDKSVSKPAKAPLPILAMLAGGIAAIAARSVAGIHGTADLIVAGLCGAGVAWLGSRRRRTNQVEAANWRMESDLPNVLERVVMGVTAGLDVIPAIAVAVPGKENETTPESVDALVRRALNLHERGLSFVQSIESVCASVKVASVRHAFIHLGMAQQQGGELIKPLRELADATQLYYQERVDEEIAKLPVKATLPLLVTFAGLIIFFVTIPVIQVSSMTKKITAATTEAR